MDLIAHLAATDGLERGAFLRRREIDLSDLPPGVTRWKDVVYLDGLVPLARVHAFAHNGVVTCVSAAELHGLPVLQPAHHGHTHIAVPHSHAPRASRTRSVSGVVIHRERGAIGTDLDRPWLADLPTTLARALHCLPLYEGIALVDAAWCAGTCFPEDIPTPRRGPTAPLVQMALQRCRSKARSILETFARLILEDAGIVAEGGVIIVGIGEVDLIVFGRLVIELDGWEFHSSQAQRIHDLERDRRLLAAGYLVMRFDYHTVMETPEVFLAEILAVRAHALTHPAPTR